MKREALPLLTRHDLAVIGIVLVWTTIHDEERVCLQHHTSQRFLCNLGKPRASLTVR